MKNIVQTVYKEAGKVRLYYKFTTKITRNIKNRTT